MDREVLSIILIFAFLLLLGVVVYLNSFNNRIDATIKEKIWKDVLKLKEVLKSNNPSLYRDALVRMDSLLARSLKLYYRNNESCGMNLKKAKELFNRDEYDKIWKIHKMRNKIVHEDYEVSDKEFNDGYNVISKAIKKILYEK